MDKGANDKRIIRPPPRTTRINKLSRSQRQNQFKHTAYKGGAQQGLYRVETPKSSFGHIIAFKRIKDGSDQSDRNEHHGQSVRQTGLGPHQKQDSNQTQTQTSHPTPRKPFNPKQQSDWKSKYRHRRDQNLQYPFGQMNGGGIRCGIGQNGAEDRDNGINF